MRPTRAKKKEEMEPRLAVRELTQHRFPIAVLVILAFLAAALPIELYYNPDRGNVYLLILGVELGFSSIALSLARTWPHRVRSVATAWAAGMASLVLLYYPLAGADATIAIAALTCLVAANPVLLPLGLRHHVAICLVCALGMSGLYLLGVPSSHPWPYLFLTFVAISVLSSMGAASIEKHRLEGLEREVELRRVQSDLRAALGRAEIAIEQRSRLIADVSHEVRTPVNVILGYADMLLDSSMDDAGRADLVQRIRDYGVSLDALVTQLLDLSRLNAGRCEVASEEVELGSLLEEVAGGARLLVRGKPVDVEVAWNGESIVTDGLRLRQILHNLVTNAARATMEGTISIRAQRHGERCRFTVTDTGCGIPKDRQEQIFAAFEQVDATGGEGIGLGLAIVRQLAEVLGGEVSVHSAPGLGAAFTVDLPTVAAPSAKTGKQLRRALA